MAQQSQSTWVREAAWWFFFGLILCGWGCVPNMSGGTESSQSIEGLKTVAITHTPGVGNPVLAEI